MEKQYQHENERVSGTFLPAERVQVEEPVLQHRDMPAAVKERVHLTEKIEVQPTLHREREQLEIHQIEQPIKERKEIPVQIRQELLPTHDIGEFREERAKEALRPPQQSTLEQTPLETQTIRKKPIVDEHVTRKIIEEVQPVIYRETEQASILQRTQPFVEKVVEAPVVSHEVLPMKETPSQYVGKESQQPYASAGGGFQQFGQQQGGQYYSEGTKQFGQGQQLGQGQQFGQGQQLGQGQYGQGLQWEQTKEQQATQLDAPFLQAPAEKKLA